MHNKDIERFYLKLMKNYNLKNRLDKLKEDFKSSHTNSVTVDKYKEFLQKNIVPLARDYGFSFTADEMFEYEKSILKVADKYLERIAGGVSARNVKIWAISSLLVMSGISFGTSPVSATSGAAPASSYSVPINKDIKGIDIDWNKKFSKMKINTKNILIKMFCSKKWIKLYEEHNKNLAVTEQKAIKITDDLNQAIKRFKDTLEYMEEFYNDKSNQANEYAKTTAALQKKIQNLSESFRKAKNNLKNRAPIPSIYNICESSNGYARNDISASLNSFGLRIDPLYSDMNRAREEMYNVENDVRNLELEIRNNNGRISEDNTKLYWKNMELPSESSFSQLKGRINDSENEIEKLKIEYSNAADPEQKRSINQKIEACRRNIWNCKKELNDLHAKKDRMSNEINELKYEICTLEVNVKNLNVKLDSKRRKLLGLISHKNEIASRLSVIKNDIEKFNMKIYEDNYRNEQEYLEGKTAEIEELIRNLKVESRENVKEPSSEYCVSSRSNIVDILNKLINDSQNLARQFAAQEDSINRDLEDVSASKSYADHAFKGFFVKFKKKQEDLNSLNKELDAIQTNVDLGIKLLDKIESDTQNFKIPKKLTKDDENRISSEIRKELQKIEEIEAKIKRLEDDTRERFADSDNLAFIKMTFDHEGILRYVSQGKLAKS